MPHFIIEYTSNIKAEADIPKLLAKSNAILMAQNGDGRLIFVSPLDVADNGSEVR